MDHSELIRKINRSQILLDSIYVEIAEHYGITFNALMVIYTLAEQPDVTQRAICEEYYLSKSTVHSIVNDFMKKGWVTFSDKKIGKEKVLSFTPEGKTLSVEIMKKVREAEENVLAYLGSKHCEELEAISGRLAEYFERRSGDACKD